MSDKNLNTIIGALRNNGIALCDARDAAAKAIATHPTSSASDLVGYAMLYASR